MVSKALGPPPTIRVEVEEDHTAHSRCDEGFLRLRRLSLRNTYPDGGSSRVYRYDVVEREAMDAVGIVLWTPGPDGPRVCLRSALRPPLAFRDRYALPVDDAHLAPVLWEIPAGLVEPEERGAPGLRECASRETLEEVGLEVAPEAFAALGAPACLSPGVLAEKVHFLVARVDPDAGGEPTADGSAVEEHAEVRFVPLSEALEAVRDGRIGDLKTEVGLRRLAEHGGVA